MPKSMANSGGCPGRCDFPLRFQLNWGVQLTSLRELTQVNPIYQGDNLLSELNNSLHGAQ